MGVIPSLLNIYARNKRYENQLASTKKREAEEAREKERRASEDALNTKVSTPYLDGLRRIDTTPRDRRY